MIHKSGSMSAHTLLRAESLELLGTHPPPADVYQVSLRLLMTRQLKDTLELGDGDSVMRLIHGLSKLPSRYVRDAATVRVVPWMREEG